MQDSFDNKDTSKPNAVDAPSDEGKLVLLTSQASSGVQQSAAPYDAKTRPSGSKALVPYEPHYLSSPFFSPPHKAIQPVIYAFNQLREVEHYAEIGTREATYLALAAAYRVYFPYLEEPAAWTAFMRRVGISIRGQSWYACTALISYLYPDETSAGGKSKRSEWAAVLDAVAAKGVLPDGFCEFVKNGGGVQRIARAHRGSMAGSTHSGVAPLEPSELAMFVADVGTPLLLEEGREERSFSGLVSAVLHISDDGDHRLVAQLAISHDKLIKDLAKTDEFKDWRSRSTRNACAE
ncbi:hypothetical protein [Ahrensia sp. R2A130]|uniref:hypothetical protein n=1 Tax=Ahrensia sp. R2A130 TaxID=744979 RepID=UPI0001E0E042|nr:hypothetical protein [Ahrensia sp. R2A130]EFL90897.1 molybdopterin binding domain-containing protein [Ahrensia sp. R2A130]